MIISSCALASDEYMDTPYYFRFPTGCSTFLHHDGYHPPYMTRVTHLLEMPSSDQETPGSDMETSGNEMKTPGSDKETPGSDHNIPKLQ